MLNLRNLVDEKFHIRNKLLGVMIVYNVHIYALFSTGQKRLLILLIVDTMPDLGKHERSGIDRLQITTRHLQD